MLDIEYFGELLDSIVFWFQNEVLVISNMVEMGIIFILFLLSYYLNSRLKPFFNNLLRKMQKYTTARQRKRIVSEVLYSFILMLLFGFYFILGEALNLPNVFADILSTLLLAWVIINVISIFLPTEKPFLKIIIFFIWTVTILHIIGILDKTVEILDRIAYPVGDFRLSLLLLIRAAILLCILYWLAGKITEVINRRIKKSNSLTPSIKVLINKLIKIGLLSIIFFITLNTIGIELSSLAFLGGAIGLGLGFGLQKVVSNFFSGIIILMDKSVKPGDVIEINEIFGKIKSQETRFVSMVTRSGKEHLIPNENFITDEVINWSYSDDIVRVEVGIGVSYGSDMRLVEDLLLKAVMDRDRVLQKPEPRCLLLEFAENTVNFELRFWINDPDQGIANIKSEVLFAVWDLLTENDINIAYPQRDLHFKSINPEMMDVLKRSFQNGKGLDEAAVTEENDEIGGHDREE